MPMMEQAVVAERAQGGGVTSDAAARRRLRRNALADITGEGLWGFQANMILSATVLVVLLRKLGAGPALIGSIAAIEASYVLPQLAGTYLFRSRRKRRWRLIVWHLVFMIPFLAAMGVLALLSDHLPAAWVRGGLLACYGLFMLGIGTCVAAWFDWVAHLFKREVRGTVMGLAACVSSGAGVGGALLAARLLGPAPTPRDFGVLYLLAAVFATLSILAFITVDDPGETEPEPAQATLRTVVGHMRDSLRDGNFRNYLLGRALAASGFCVLPLITAYYASPAGGNVAARTIVAAGAVLALANAAANLVFGRIGDRWGHRIGIISGAMMQVVGLTVVLLVPGTAGCVLACACAGLVQSAGFLAHTNLLIETCRHENRLAHMTAGNLLLAPVTIVAPLVAAQVAGLMSSRIVFGACLGFSLAAVGWFTLKLREPRSLAVPVGNVCVAEAVQRV